MSKALVINKKIKKNNKYTKDLNITLETLFKKKINPSLIH